MRNRFRVFDTHTHIGVAAHSGNRYSADQLLASMDKNGVDRAAVIPFPVLENCREANDTVGRAVAAHPDRLIGVAYVYPAISEKAFREEVNRCVEQWGARALKLQPQYQPINPLHERFDYVFETALEHRLPVICHTGNGIPATLPSLFMVPARKFPQLKFILAHAGGGGMLVGEVIVAAKFCPNIYLELSTLMPNHVRLVLSHVGSSRVMIGSDLPENAAVEIDKIFESCDSDTAKQDILWNTAAGIFGDRE